MVPSSTSDSRWQELTCGRKIKMIDNGTFVYYWFAMTWINLRDAGIHGGKQCQQQAGDNWYGTKGCIICIWSIVGSIKPDGGRRRKVEWNGILKVAEATEIITETRPRK